MLILQNIQYRHPDKELLFDRLHFSLDNRQKTALIGNNGAGKSTLLRIMAGEIAPSAGQLIIDSRPYYVPQQFGQFNNWSVARSLNIEDKLMALKSILSGNTSENNFNTLQDDWTIEERCHAALEHWQLDVKDLSQGMEQLSGGQKTKVFLSGILIHQPEIVLLDEPSNHLDLSGRKLLYDFMQSCNCSLIIASHDRKTLRLTDSVCELNKKGITVYGGNYDFYLEQKNIEKDALHQDVKSQEKALRKAKETERETTARKQKQDARGRKKQEKAGVPTIALNTLRNNAEKSTARIKGIHEEKINLITHDLNTLRKELPEIDKMKLDFEHSTLHKGKKLFSAQNINYGYNSTLLWKEPLNFEIVSGSRLLIKGDNGSGKTSLIKIISGILEPVYGNIFRADNNVIYIDQDYSLIDNCLTVFGQATLFNSQGFEEHELKIRLNRFLFGKEDWNKSCNNLSGGEKMRLLLCCLNITNQTPDIIILDEPTNNLDIQNTEILTLAIKSYSGTLIVVSHDQYFLEEIGINNELVLK